jgi:hypothetical protein
VAKPPRPQREVWVEPTPFRIRGSILWLFVGAAGIYWWWKRRTAPPAQITASSIAAATETQWQQIDDAARH